MRSQCTTPFSRTWPQIPLSRNDSRTDPGRTAAATFARATDKLATALFCARRWADQMSVANEPRTAEQPKRGGKVRGRLLRKYVALFVAVVALALAANGVVEIWFSWREQNSALLRTQRVLAEAAAARISQF